jgi:2-polyprenyl-3-methyl-5-hydroxy-6-metoxy-1,4-benzoquinol methylase
MYCSRFFRCLLVRTKKTIRDGPPARQLILDVRCGTGRHSIRLPKRGYAVTGLDVYCIAKQSGT